MRFLAFNIITGGFVRRSADAHAWLVAESGITAGHIPCSTVVLIVGVIASINCGINLDGYMYTLSKIDYCYNFYKGFAASNKIFLHKSIFHLWQFFLYLDYSSQTLPIPALDLWINKVSTSWQNVRSEYYGFSTALQHLSWSFTSR